MRVGYYFFGRKVTEAAYHIRNISNNSATLTIIWLVLKVDKVYNFNVIFFNLQCFLTNVLFLILCDYHFSVL